MRSFVMPCLLVAAVACGSKQSRVESPNNPGDPPDGGDGDVTEPPAPVTYPMVVVPHDNELQVVEASGEVVAHLPAVEVQSALAVSADGKVLAAGRGFAPTKNGWTEDGQIWLWDIGEMSGGAEVAPTAVLEGHKREMIVALAFTADKSKLMSAGDRGRLILWDLATRKPLQTWKIPYASAASMSPDGKWFVTHHLDGVRFWSLDSKKGVKLDVPASCMDSAFSPESNRYAVACKNVVYEFEPGNNKPVRQLETKLQFGRGVAYSDKYLASLNNEKEAIVWDRESGEVSAEVQFGPASLDDAYRLVFDSTGRTLGAAYCSQVLGYDLTAKSKVFTLSMGEVSRCRPALAFIPH